MPCDIRIRKLKILYLSINHEFFRKSNKSLKLIRSNPKTQVNINMNLTPTRKSIFAPSNQPKTDLTSASSKFELSLQGDKSHEIPDSFLLNLPSPSPHSFERAPVFKPIIQRSALKKSKTRVENKIDFKFQPSAPADMQATKLKKNASAPPKRAYLKSATVIQKRSFNIDPKSPRSGVPAEMLTPTLFKEYKYRRISVKHNSRKPDPENEIRIMERLSIFSAHGSGITDTRPVDPPRIRGSKRVLTSINVNPVKNPIRASFQNSFLYSRNSSGINTPSYFRKLLGDAMMSGAPSQTSDDDDEDTFSTERLRHRRKLKKGLYASYFLGIMFTFRSKVKIFGALRPIDYLDQFESVKLPEKKKTLLPLLPTSHFGITWGFIIMFFLILSAVLTPVYISFVDDDNKFFYYLNLVTDIGFSIDILVNFISAYYDSDHELVTSFRLIALNYLKMWFWVDTLSVIPLNDIIQWITSVEASATGANKIMKLLKFPRMYKLVKIVRLIKLAKTFSSSPTLSQVKKAINLNTRITKLARIFINFIFLNHLVGCLWFYLARMDDFGPDTWVQRGDLIDKDAGAQYIASLYWSLQTLTTVGYGDIAPQTSLERSAASIWTVIGVLIYSFTVGNLSTIFFSFGVRAESLKDKLTSFEQFSREVGLPDFLSQKVRRVFEYKFDRTLSDCLRINHKENAYHCIDSKDMLKSLPANFKRSLLIFSYYDKIKLIKLLQINPNLTAALLVHFDLLQLREGEMIYREDDTSNEIYFILKGSVKFITQNAKDIYSLSEGTYFGDIEVFEGTKRRCFCQALTSTLLLICPKDQFLKALIDFPDIKGQMEKIMQMRKTKLEEKLERIRKAAEEEEKEKQAETKEKQKVLCKTTEYINKVLLKIPDAQIRYEMRRKRERSLIRKSRKFTLTKNSRKLIKPMSLANLGDSKGTTLESLPRRIFQKSMQDLPTYSQEDHSKSKNNTQRKSDIEVNKKVGSQQKKGQFSRDKDSKGNNFLTVPNQIHLNPNILTVCDTNENLIPKFEDYGHLLMEQKETLKSDTETLPGQNNTDSIITIKTKTSSTRKETSAYTDSRTRLNSNIESKGLVKSFLNQPIKTASKIFSSIKRKISKYFKSKPNRIVPMSEVKKNRLMNPSNKEKERKMRINFFLAPNE